MTITTVFHQPLRRSAAALALTGTALAVSAFVLASSRHRGTGQVLAYALVAAGTVAWAIAVLRAVRWVLWLTAVVLGGQILAVFGTVAELVVGVESGKAANLRGLGFNPTVAVLVNLVYSAIAVGLFGWLVVRWRRRRRAVRLSGRGVQQGP